MRVISAAGNGLLPDGTKPLPEPRLTYHQWNPVAFNWSVSQEMHKISIIRKYVTKLHIKKY